MKKLFFTFAVAALTTAVQAQEQTPQQTARTFMLSGDFDNAVLVLTRALQSDNNNLELQKDLALSLYYKRDFAKALEVVEKLMDNDGADVASFQIAGTVYKALEEVKSAEKIYKKGLRKFPGSGPLYSEYGELLLAKKNPDAIEQWEKGIKADPSYAGNYYNAALYYFSTKDKVWSLINGEIFLNMENLTDRATQMKSLLLAGYTDKLFSDADIMKDQDRKLSPFGKAFLETMNKQSGLVAQGLNLEVLTAIRTRFILDWYQSWASRFPFKLFDYQQQLLREGMFEAYNQWLFSTPENLPAYDAWTKTHGDAYNKFSAFQKSRVFKMPHGQFYGE